MGHPQPIKILVIKKCPRLPRIYSNTRIPSTDQFSSTLLAMKCKSLHLAAKKVHHACYGSMWAHVLGRHVGWWLSVRGLYVWAWRSRVPGLGEGWRGLVKRGVKIRVVFVFLISGANGLLVVGGGGGGGAAAAGAGVFGGWKRGLLLVQDQGFGGRVRFIVHLISKYHGDALIDEGVLVLIR